MPFDPYAYDLARAAKEPSKPGAALAADPLLAVPEEARFALWQGLTRAVDGALEVWERTPASQRAAPRFTVQHAGKRRFKSDDLREQTLEGWHRLTGLEMRLAAQALEALLLAGDVEVYAALLAEQCARVGQLYSELKRRVGWRFALHIFRWETRMLRYRASPTLAPLVYK